MANLLLVASVSARVSPFEFKIPAAGPGALNPCESPCLCKRKIKNLLDLAESLKGMVWKDPSSLHCFVFLAFNESYFMLLALLLREFNYL